MYCAILIYFQNWWFWLVVTGVMLGSAFSVKFVGLFVILLVSLAFILIKRNYYKYNHFNKYKDVLFLYFIVHFQVGINTVEQLWDVLGDMSRPVWPYTIQHFAARALCLILLPVILYIAFFYIHLSVLYKT